MMYGNTSLDTASSVSQSDVTSHRQEDNAAELVVDLSHQGLSVLSLDRRRCRTLQRLDLSHNHFLTFPLPLGYRMDALRELRLRGQAVPGNASIHKWRGLRDLPPDTFRCLPNLVRLDLSQNSLGRLPESLTVLTRLESLDLRFNAFRTFPAAICQLTTLRVLALSNNRIAEVPQAVGNLRRLQVLRLSSNGLRWLPDELCLLEGLQTLTLASNAITHLPQELYRLRGLCGEAAAAAASAEPTGLCIHDNPLEYPPHHACQQGTLPMFQFMENNRHLGKTLDLRGRGLDRFPTTTRTERRGEGPSVTIIEATKNRLRNLPDDLSERFCKLDTLSLAENEFEDLPGCLYEVRGLRALSLQAQRDRCFSRWPLHLGLMDNLQELYLAHNGIAEICGSSMGPLQRLRVLDLRDNELKALPDEMCKLQNLECLILRDNGLAELPAEIGRLGRLRVLQLSGNRLTKLPDSLCELRQLCVLSLRQNRLVYLPPNLDRLRNLSSDEPFFLSVASTTFWNRALKLSGNEGTLVFPPWSACSASTTSTSRSSSHCARAVFGYLARIREHPELLLEQLEEAKARERTVSRGEPQMEGVSALSTQPSVPIQQQAIPGRPHTLTDRTLFDVAERLTAGDFWQLGVLLDLSPATLDQIKTDHQAEGLKCQLWHMLLHWVRSRGGAPVEEQLIEQLKRQLVAVGRRDVVEQLLQ